MSSSSTPAPSERRTTVTPGRRTHRTHRPGRTALVVLAVVALLVAGAIGANSAVTARNAAGAVSELATALADGLETGDLNGVPLLAADGEPEPTPQAELDTILAGTGPAAAAVEVAATHVESAGDREASATLSWTWQLGESGETWEYSTDVLLRDDPTDTSESGWTAVWTPSVVEPSLSDGEALVAESLAPDLGTVQAADGTVLVDQVPSTVIGLETEGLDAAAIDSSAVAITEALDLDPDNFRDRIAESPDGAFVPAITIRDEQLDRFDTEAALAASGAAERSTTLLLELDRYFAPGIIGQTSWASAAVAAASDGEIAEGDMVADSGLVSTLLDELTGTSGFRIVAGPADTVTDPEEPLGGELPDGARALVALPTSDGADVTTSLDPTLQDRAQDVLAETENPSALVAIRPSTGEIVAAGAGPQWSTYPRGVVGQYAPGSTFKVVSALGLLRSGYTPETEMECPANVTVDGFQFKNADSFSPALEGTMTLTEVIAHSCNTALAGAGSEVAPQTLADAASALGIGQENGTGHPEAFLGALPTDDSATSHAADMIGQGTVLASPLAMANVAASVQQGTTVQPTFGTTEPGAQGEGPAVPLTEDEAAQLRGLMRAPVTEGNLDAFAAIPGEPVHAKTGTAEAQVDGSGVLNSWTIAFQGDLAVAVLVEDGGYGSETAAPIVGEFLRGEAPAGE